MRKTPPLMLMISVTLMSGRISSSSGQGDKEEGLNASAKCEPSVVMTGSEASITCRFDINLLETKRGFKVEKFDWPGQARSQADLVLFCYWTEGNLECNVRQGYSYDYDVRCYVQLKIPDMRCGVQLKIPDAQPSFSGLYLCSLEPDHNPQQCNLTVEDPRTTLSQQQDTTAIGRSSQTRDNQTRRAKYPGTAAGRSNQIHNEQTTCAKCPDIYPGVSGVDIAVLVVLIIILCICVVNLLFMIRPHFINRISCCKLCLPNNKHAEKQTEGGSVMAVNSPLIQGQMPATTQTSSESKQQEEDVESFHECQNMVGHGLTSSV